MILHHFTCSHQAKGIIADGLIVPHPQPVLGGIALSWFTDSPTLSHHDLGLQSTTLDCDRMAYHFMVPASDGPTPWPTPLFVRWDEFAASERVDRTAVSALNLGRKHGNWWVSKYPVEFAEYGW